MLDLVSTATSGWSCLLICVVIIVVVLVVLFGGAGNVNQTEGIQAPIATATSTWDRYKLATAIVVTPQPATPTPQPTPTFSVPTECIDYTWLDNGSFNELFIVEWPSGYPKTGYVVVTEMHGGGSFLNRPAVAAEEFEPFPVTGAESIFGFWCPTHESTP